MFVFLHFSIWGHLLLFFRYFIFIYISFYMGKMAKISPKIDKIKVWPKSRPKVINSWIKSHGVSYLGNVWPIKVVLEFWFGHSKCHFLWSENSHFCQKCPFLRLKKWHFEEPNQNSKTTFIVQTFPKYGPYDFYFMNLSLLGAILPIFQFCRFSGLFWPFFPCKKG